MVIPMMYRWLLSESPISTIECFYANVDWYSVAVV